MPLALLNRDLQTYHMEPPTHLTQRSRHWCFTDYSPATPSFDMEDGIEYAIWQREKCPKTGREHWQGYIEFTNARKIKSVVAANQTGSKMHVEPRKGTRTEARDYCKKADTQILPPTEIGQWKEEQGQGKRNDLNELAEKLLAGATEEEIATEHGGHYIRYWRGIARLAALGKERTWQTEVKVFKKWDEVKYAISTHPVNERVFYFNINPWFDGYDGQEICVWDFADVDPKKWTKALVRRLMGSNPLRVETKGGMVPWLCKTLYVYGHTADMQLYMNGWCDANAPSLTFNTNTEVLGNTIKPKLVIEAEDPIFEEFGENPPFQGEGEGLPNERPHTLALPPLPPMNNRYQLGTKY